MSQPDPLEEITGGDAAAAGLLRRNLSQLAEHHRGTPTGELLAEVLSGRRPVSDLHTDVGFAEIVTDGVNRYRAYLDSLEPGQRAALTREAEELLGEDSAGEA